jgi:hypothetical protein
MGVSDGRYQSFLVRIWARKGHFVHGEITDASTRESVRFREFPRLLRFILAGVRRSDDELLAELQDEVTVLPSGAELPVNVLAGPGARSGKSATNSRLTPD